MPLPKPQLDHIVLVLPYSSILTPPAWLTSLFTISPGGKHGDSKTENKLVLFADGSYLELISFVSDAAREGHWWGDKGHGIVDYAFTLPNGAKDYEQLRARWDELDVPAGWKPGPLKHGSRTKPDGTRIEWEVAFPDPKERGVAPFWCFDVTPRERRVPSDASGIEHPCGAKGVGELLWFVDGERRAGLKRLLDAAVPTKEGGRVDEFTWDVDTPRKIERTVPCALGLLEAKGEGEREALGRRKVLGRLVLLTDGRDEGLVKNVREVVEGDEVSIGFVTS